MSEAALYVLAALYVVFALVDLVVARRLIAEARLRPAIDALTAAAVVSVAITVGCVIGVALGLNGILLNLGLPRILPMPWGVTLLAVALGVPSAANIYLLRLIRRWDGQGRGGPRPTHRRAADPAPTSHSRADDRPETGG